MRGRGLRCDFADGFGGGCANLLLGIVEHLAKRPEGARIADLPKCRGGGSAHGEIGVFQGPAEGFDGAWVAQFAKYGGCSPTNEMIVFARSGAKCDDSPFALFAVFEGAAKPFGCLGTADALECFHDGFAHRIRGIVQCANERFQSLVGTELSKGSRGCFADLPVGIFQRSNEPVEDPGCAERGECGEGVCAGERQLRRVLINAKKWRDGSRVANLRVGFSTRGPAERRE